MAKLNRWIINDLKHKKQTWQHGYGPLRWNYKKKKKKKKCPWSHLREVLPLLTRCPSPISPWCAAWRPSCGHGWGGPPAPASSGPRFHSSRAKVGGTNPPRSSVEAGNSGGEKKKKKRKKTVERNTQRRRLKVEIDRRGTTEWGWRMERKMQIRRYCCFGPPESENGVRGKHISAYSTFRKKRGDPERGADRAT